jgi:gliding motility-associated-like protein
MQLYARILSTILFILAAFQVSGQVVAGFTATPSSGCAPLVVTFTNSSTPVSGTTYSWSLGNGTGLITLTNPSTSYFTAGTYTVTLTATNSGFSNTHTQIITVYPNPVVDFTVSDTALCPGAPFTFTSTTSPGVPGTVRYLWSFGDGYTATTASVIHAYGLPGHFNVSLSATNAVGCTSTLTKPSLIHAFTPPVPVFSAVTPHVCKHSGSVSFTSAPVGTPPFIYRWSFGDDSPSVASANPAHFYAAPGYYPVKLVVTDAHGCMDSLTKPAYINVTNLTAAFAGPDSACAYSPVTFVNTSTNFLTSAWLYGNGGADTTRDGHTTYTATGTYSVWLIATDSFCHDTAYRTLLVPHRVTDFTVPEWLCPSPVAATYSVSVTPGSTVTWSFSDTSVATGNPVTHTYMKDTIFGITMIATSPMGCKDTVSKLSTVYGMLTEKGLSPVAGACIPVTVHGALRTYTTIPAGALALYPESITYSWDWGDGTPVLPGGAGIHTYTAVGIYYITATAVSLHGCIRVLTDSFKTGTRPHATFTATPLRSCYRDSVAFTRTLVSGPADQYEWLFGEGMLGYSTIEHTPFDTVRVMHHFSIPGIFSDTLISFYHFCPDTFIRTRYVTIDSPRAGAIRSVVCSLSNTVRFVSTSIGADSVMWIFADGATSTLTNVVHTFPSSGVFINKITAYNVRSGCRDTAFVFVDLRKPVVAFYADDTAICRDDRVTFTTSLISGLTTNYIWVLPGGGSPDTVVNTDNYSPSFTTTYHIPGRYPVTLIKTDQNRCPDTVTKTNYMLVAQPVARFTVSPPGLCWPQVTTFLDSTTDQFPAFQIAHVWSFGDGTSINTGGIATVAHTYTATGTYHIKEVLTDNVGCMDSISFTRSLYNAKALFTASTVNACVNANVNFTNWSAPITAAFQWSFGDGYTSALSNPVHAYTASGHYNVRLIVTDPHGCRDSFSTVIGVSRPHASFYLSDSVAVCPPFTVLFINTSTGGISNLWNLGNGTSVALNPVDVYTAPAYDTISLIVTDAYGCRDTATGKHVKVYGYSGDFTYSADSGCAPLAILFNANFSNISLVSSFIWDFSDGVTSTPSLSDTITHFYLAPGRYIPKLIISSHSGCNDTSAGKNPIKVDAVNPGFTASPVCIRNPTYFTDTSRSYWSHISSWLWSYNGTTSTLPAPATTYTVPGFYTVSLRVTDAWGCVGNDTESIYVYTLPSIVTVPDSMLCTGNTIALSDSVGGGLWTSGTPGVAAVGSGTGIVTGLAAGTVLITYTVDGNCYITTPVTVNAHPDPGTISGTGVCVGSVTTLSDSVAGGVWSITNGNAIITPGGTVKGIMPGMDTVVYTVTNINCPSEATKAIIVFPLPDPGTITGMDTICKDALITLTESNTGGHWSSGSTSIATVDTSGLVKGIGVGAVVISYTSAPDSNGCSNIATFPIDVINADFSITPLVTVVKCFGDANGNIAVTINNGKPPFQYLWSNGSTASSIDSLSAGTYSVKISEPTTQCTLSETFNVPSPDSIRIGAEVNADICDKANGSIKLISSGGTPPYLYLWGNKSVNSEISGLGSGKYSCTVTDANGCISYFSMVLEDSTCPEIIIHDGISPNGDGINDTWVIEGLQHYPNNTVKVFDKWGDQIFEESNYKNDWYGKGKNGLVPDGTYYYLLKLNTDSPPHGKESYTGALLIKR